MIQKIKNITLQEKEAYLYDWINATEIIFTEKIQTLGVNKQNQLIINPSFISRLSNKELIFVLFHELFHIIYEHTKTTNKNLYLVNVAGDIYINEQLLQLGYTILQGGLLKKTFSVPSYLITVEEIYLWLEKNLTSEQKQQLQEQNELESSNQEIAEQIGEEQSEESISTSQEMEQIFKDIKKDLEQKISKKIKLQEEIPIKWDIDLKKEIGRLIKREEIRHYRRPPRYAPEGIIRPSHKLNTSIPKVNLYIDKSGSMKDTLGVVIASLKDIKAKLKTYIPTYYTFDTEIHEIKENELDSICASGGTEFRSIKVGADIHIILTDGELDFEFIDKQKDIIVYEIKDNNITRRLK